MAVELFLLSGLYATGNVTRYFVESWKLRNGRVLKDGSCVEVLQNVEKLIHCSVEEAKQPPIYLLTGGLTQRSLQTNNFVFEGILTNPREMSRCHYSLPEFEETSRLPSVWLTTPKEVEMYLDSNQIPLYLASQIACLELPFKVREISLNPKTPVYAVKRYGLAGTNKKKVIHSVLVGTRILKPSMFVCGSMVYLTTLYLKSEWKAYTRLRSRPCFFHFVKQQSLLGRML